MVEKVLYTLYNKMIVSERDRIGSGVFRSINKAELHSVIVSAPGSQAIPSFLLVSLIYRKFTTPHCQPD